MNIELASYLGLIGSGVAIAAFFVLTLVGIFFVRLLDAIEGYCTRAAMRWKKANANPFGLGISGRRSLNARRG
jgi:hypothetical protein